MDKTITIRSGLWSYRGWYIKRISLRAQVGTSTMYEIHDDLRELEECIGFPRYVNLAAAKARIRHLTKQDNHDRIQ